jgi:hypothetical protein
MDKRPLACGAVYSGYASPSITLSVINGLTRELVARVLFSWHAFYRSIPATSRDRLPLHTPSRHVCLTVSHTNHPLTLCAELPSSCSCEKPMVLVFSGFSSWNSLFRQRKKMTFFNTRQELKAKRIHGPSIGFPIPTQFLRISAPCPPVA